MKYKYDLMKVQWVTFIKDHHMQALIVYTNTVKYFSLSPK